MSKLTNLTFTLSADQIAVLTHAVVTQIAATSSEKKGGVAEKYLQGAEYTKKTCIAAFEDVTEHIGKKEAKALLKAFDAKKVKDLDEANYKDFWTSAQEMLAEVEVGENIDEPEQQDNVDEYDTGDGIDRDELKKAIQKIAAKDKEAASELLQNAGLNTVRGMAKATEAVIEKLFKGVKKYNK